MKTIVVYIEEGTMEEYQDLINKGEVTCREIREEDRIGISKEARDGYEAVRMYIHESKDGKRYSENTVMDIEKA